MATAATEQCTSSNNSYEPTTGNAYAPHVSSFQFRFFTDEEIEKISVLEITQHLSHDDFHNPIKGGIHDSRLGTSGFQQRCVTCGLEDFFCPGHFGHVNLPQPLYNPHISTEYTKVLNSCCASCWKFLLPQEEIDIIYLVLNLLDCGLYNQAKSIYENPIGYLVDNKVINKFKNVEENKKLTKDYILALEDHCNELIKEQEQNYGLKRKELFLKYKNDPLLFEMKMLLKLNIFSKSPQKCSRCGLPKLNFKIIPEGNFVCKPSEQVKKQLSKYLLLEKSLSTEDNFVYTKELLNLFDHLYNSRDKKQAYIFYSLYGQPLKYLLSSKLLITPIRFRPVSKILGQKKDSTLLLKTDMDSNYDKILEKLSALKNYEQQLEEGTLHQDFKTHTYYHSLIREVQVAYNNLVKGGSEGSRTRSVTALLDKKPGLIRQSLMGKRVNYSARTVILPDASINCNEVNFPLIFAKNLTFKEYVNNINLHEMRRLVMNGSNIYPGANKILKQEQLNNSITYTSGPKPIYLDKITSQKQREVLANQLQVGDIVYRHCKDGDMLLMNRQPTLHRSSILAHRARIIANQRIIRLHYASCKSFNADFDGDELNSHLPQNFIAQSEARDIMGADKGFVVPTSGEPIRGLIQDHVSAAVLLTKKDNFLTYEEYQHLVYSAMIYDKNDIIELELPCIFKPKPLYTGKQVITTILKHISKKYKRDGINLECKTKLKASVWKGHEEESIVIIKDNELLTGVFDKSQVGSSKYGILHAFDECYGNSASNILISCLGRLFTFYLSMFSITCGIDDCLLSKKAEENRKVILKEANEACNHTTAQFCGLTKRKDTSHYDLEKVTTFLSKNLLYHRVENRFHTNSNDKKKRNNFINEKFQRKLDSTVKKSINTYTTKAISQSIPLGQLKAFPLNMLSLMTESGAKGSMVNSSQIAVCLGLQEFEGKRVSPMIKSGKTLPSFQPFESTNIANGYVASRFLTGMKPQEFYFHCMAGRDGLIDTAVKTARSGYLQRCLIKHLENISVHYDGTVRQSNQNVLQFHYGGDHIDPLKTGYLHQFDFMSNNEKLLNQRYNRDETLKYIKTFDNNKMDLTSNKAPHDTWNYLGAVSNTFNDKLNDYLDKVKIETLKDKKKRKEAEEEKKKSIQSLAYLKYLKSLIEPGENVGIIAAQSIGEPSTQMTLNTFHFAGLDMAHVTVGIPRLVELFMTGSTSTKTMSIPVKSTYTNIENIYKFADNLCKVPFFTVLKNVNVIEELQFTQSVKQKKISIELSFDIKDINEYYLIDKDSLEIKFLIPLILMVPKIITNKKHVYNKLKKQLFNYSYHASAASANDEMIDEEEDNKEDKKKKDTTTNKDGNDEEEGQVEKKKQQQAKKQVKKDMSDDDKSDNSSDDDEDDEKKNMKEGKEDIKSLFKKYLIEYEDYSIDSTNGIIKCSFIHSQEDDSDKVFIAEGIYDVLKNCYLRRTEGIENVTVLPLNDGKFELSIEGFNFIAIQSLPESYEMFELNKLTTNNIKLMADYYGIEAANQKIVKDVLQVFEMYGMDVNERHIQLIADYLTNSSEYKSCNRGTLRNHPFTFYRASFEQATVGLTTGAVRAEDDYLQSPSAEIIAGKPIRSGTGAFDLLLLNK
ncbi:hypothetical protein ABK040_007076 [Willaertia magna]